MKYSLYIISGLLLLFTSCENLLDITPKSEIAAEELFEDVEGFEDAMYGIYSQMQEDFLYGRFFQVVPDVLAQYYEYGGEYEKFMSYEYSSDANVQMQMNKAWTDAYTLLGQVNSLLDNADKDFDDINYDLVRGEALGVRAFIHFDLLRLFAVDIRSNSDLKSRAIPYAENYTLNQIPFYSVEEVYEKVINDLLEAEQLLAYDTEIFADYPRDATSISGEGFLYARETHFNLHAAQATLARVYWMKGDMGKALLYAEKVINSGKFSLVNTTLEMENLVAGRINGIESIWGVYSQRNISSLYLGASSLYVQASVKDMFIAEDTRNDAWFQDAETKVQLKKMVNRDLSNDPLDLPDYPELGLSMLRYPEMLLIAAEALVVSNPEQSRLYFDTLLEARGLSKFADREPVQNVTLEDIKTEYAKELIGEGQNWFSMKRDNRIIDSPIGEVNGDAIYTLPIPYDELSYR
ncbi:RagB/SusD family nutrient uptake outer membrane protein [Carboxylicivirga marina]|uniref:RagB/SusD family nutrient uptake outer membrane protein n=1 Tax=Carboxylicivirga marina TaxID=2800988 RepID=A0ABS1HKK1_9BACT|nr:RagB/SusD family nutrient uptake outer membrane protein [Carboxylicivirga marina]MBK3518204.1 RagB/SusD family nutrient uptake outer membrane protein [Carboxylicivirga marina]